MQKLNAKMDAIGNATSTDQLINQIKNAHVQLQDKAAELGKLEDRIGEKNSEIR